MPLRVYNTLTRQKEDFKTVEPGKVRMYVCGPTVYKPSHIGHMVGPVIFDTVARYLRYQGYDVRFVVNITDVDDKLIARAAQEKTTVKDLAEKMTADYRECLRLFGVDTITDMPKATEHIDDMKRMIEKLIAKDHAYAAGGDVYFNVTKDPDYGKLCHRDPEQMEAGARIEVSEKKRNPGDFALWKGSKPGEPAWESPWGPGRPGWHIECSAMSMRYLGETLDIHGGGLDLQFPHHENELAQSESFTDKPFVRYWMHNGLLKMGQSKMAGSIGNVVNVRDLLQKFSGETLRFFLLNSHYRSPIEFNEERLKEVQRSLESFQRFFERYERITGQSYFALTAPSKRGDFGTAGKHREFLAEVAKLREAFLNAMEDDFNTGGASGSLFELLTALNRFAETQKLEETKEAAAVADFRKGTTVLRELSGILGIFREAPAKAAAGDEQLVGALRQLVTDLGHKDKAGGDINALMQTLVDLRQEARKAKNFAVADQIRKRLTELTITLEDRAGGTGWRVG
jgi:cysteinyl-tRNA synthetase